MAGEAFGNFHFEYIGRAVGYPTNALVLAGGLYQLWTHGLETVDKYLTPYACDDPRDSYFIRLGAIKYDNEN